MFTGIVEDLGEILSVDKGTDGLVLGVNTRLPGETIGLGDSIAVNGVCLTVTGRREQQVTFDVSHESVSTTTLQYLQVGARVHLERALSFGARLGGHLVTGHVDGVGQVTGRVSRGKNLDVTILAPREVTPYLVAKGSVAIDGVSLTVNRPQGERFQVTLVPHTLEKTRLADCRPGDKLNLEADILGKYVRHFTVGSSQGVDEKFLAEHGFLET